MRKVDVADTIPPGYRTTYMQNGTTLADRFPLLLAENVSPAAIESTPAFKRNPWWQQAELGLAALDLESSFAHFMRSRQIVAQRACAGSATAMLGTRTAQANLPLLESRWVRKTHGTPHSKDEIRTHGYESGQLAAAVSARMSKQDSQGIKYRMSLHRCTALALNSIINRRADPEYVAMSASPRESLAAQDNAAHTNYIVVPEGKICLVAFPNPQAEKNQYVTPFGRGFLDFTGNVLFGKGSKQAPDVVLSTLATMLKNEHEGVASGADLKALNEVTERTINLTQYGTIIQQ